MSENIEAIRAMGFWRWLYARTLYRPLMRLAHRYNWHQTRRVGPLDDGFSFDRCDWCGFTHVEQPLTDWLGKPLIPGTAVGQESALTKPEGQ